MTRRRRIPKYGLHKATGQAVVVLSGKHYYLGKHGSEESRQEYDRLIAEWLSNRRTAPVSAPTTSEEEAVTVVEVIADYVRFAKQHYRRADGTPTGELTNVKVSLRPLTEA